MSSLGRKTEVATLYPINFSGTGGLQPYHHHHHHHRTTTTIGDFSTTKGSYVYNVVCSVDSNKYAKLILRACTYLFISTHFVPVEIAISY